MLNLKEISEILITKGKIRGKPVAISLFRDTIPPEYEPMNGEPCTVVRLAMDEGEKTYFDANHHDSLVGAYHCGMVEGYERRIIAFKLCDEIPPNVEPYGDDFSFHCAIVTEMWEEEKKPFYSTNQNVLCGGAVYSGIGNRKIS